MCVCVHTYVCIHTYIRMYVYAYVCVYVCACVCLCVCVCVCLRSSTVRCTPILAIDFVARTISSNRSACSAILAIYT